MPMTREDAGEDRAHAVFWRWSSDLGPDGEQPPAVTMTTPPSTWTRPQDGGYMWERTGLVITERQR